MPEDHCQFQPELAGGCATQGEHKGQNKGYGQGGNTGDEMDGVQPAEGEGTGARGPAFIRL